MLFNSIDFAIFLPIVFICYWFIVNKSIRQQNLLIVIASYLFYGWWNWRFIPLLLASTIVDYSVGLGLKKIGKSRKRKWLLWTSIIVNLGILGYFKYANFFIENFASAFTILGFEIKAKTLNIILPVGVSFYTFQSLSYIIDVYKRKLEATNNLLSFMAYVTFFPQLVAGPIERATHLLPQFYSKRHFNYSKAVDGMRQILWGLFKKVVIADNCAIIADLVFNNHQQFTGLPLVIGALFFAIQIYGDFSGYSDIAIGSARLFGFDLMKNFSFPYFSRDIAEFWRRWHISLSTWFKDYVYIPLGGSRGGRLMKVRNLLLIFLLSGFWHGANWTFLFWGMLNALFIIPLALSNKSRKHLDIIAAGRYWPNRNELIQVLLTFSLSSFAWIFFRSKSLKDAFEYIGGIFQRPGNFFSINLFHKYKSIPFLVLIFFLIEWLGRESEYGLQNVAKCKNKSLRWIIYYAIVIAVLFFGVSNQQFIYFQF
jgi:D-alanyl-lipoteichoic acid acyltransferase DltB (MBOAT superfamily)